MANKQRLVAITDPAELVILRAGGLECPALYEPPKDQADQTVYCDADEYRAWKSFAPTSGVTDGTG